MRAARIHGFGGPDVIRIDDLPAPISGRDEVLVRVHFGGVNFADTERRRGLYLADQPLPCTLGFEGSGVVEATGQRVAFNAPSAHAEYVAVSKQALIALPDSISLEVGATLPVQGLTAFHALFTQGRLIAGETVLITAAGGGVGTFAIQLARAAGAQVIALVGKESKKQTASEAGAHEVLIRSECTVDSRANLIIDSIGRGFTEAALNALTPFGRWVHIGDANGAPPPVTMDQLFAKSLSVSSYWLRTPHDHRRALDHLWKVLADKTLTPTISRIAELEDLPEMHSQLEAGETTGKILIRLER